MSGEQFLIYSIIAVPVFFTWRWLFRKYIKKEMTRILVACLFTLPSTFFIFEGLLRLLFISVTYVPNRSFSQESWMNNQHDRHQMADDLLKRNLLMGKDTNTVKQMLGDPIRAGFADTVWMYDMGTSSPGFGWSFHTLRINLNAAGKVSRVDHFQADD